MKNVDKKPDIQTALSLIGRQYFSINLTSRQREAVLPGALSLGHKNSESFIWRVGHIYHKNFRPINLLVKYAFFLSTVYFCLWPTRS